VDSPVGAVYVVAGRGGVRFIDQAGSPGDLADRYRARFGRSLSAPLGDAAPAQSETVAAALRGEPVEVVVDLAGLTPFQRRILEVTAGVPRGQVRSYAWVAREAGVPGAARAAGSALASNPVPLLVPCHRVVNSDGRTGRYAFGAHAKRRLLELEGVSLQEIALAPYVASRATSVLCHATCGRARALSAAERQPFRSAREAAAAGYRPCTDCRPA
jgi:methylated-DNA-[protein]-cysteine S-methyltransferase